MTAAAGAESWCDPDRKWATTSDVFDVGSDRPGDPVPPTADPGWTWRSTVVTAPWRQDRAMYAMVIWTWERTRRRGLDE